MPIDLKPLHVAVREGRRLRGRVQLVRTNAQGPTTKAVLEALRLAVARRPSPEEARWVGLIEQVRARLEASQEPMAITDHGAGSRVEASTAVPGTNAAKVTTKTLGQMTLSSKPPQWAYLLFRLVRELQPQRGLEMGSCVGISASYQAAGMRLNGSGRLMSLEGADVLAERTRTTVGGLGLADNVNVVLGPFDETLAGALAELAPLDWAFIDGHHDGPATLRYMESILASCGPEAVLLFDDINWSPGMRQAWCSILTDPRFALTVDLRSVGIAVVSAFPEARRHLTLSYY